MSTQAVLFDAPGPRARARHRVTAVVAGLLLVAPGLLSKLPTAALAAVVIASAIGLIEITDLRRIYRIQRWEFWLSIAWPASQCPGRAGRARCAAPASRDRPGAVPCRA